MVLIWFWWQNPKGLFGDFVVDLSWACFNSLSSPSASLPSHAGCVSGFGRVQPNRTLSGPASCSSRILRRASRMRRPERPTHAHLRARGREALPPEGPPWTSGGPWPRHSGQPVHPPSFSQATVLRRTEHGLSRDPSLAHCSAQWCVPAWASLLPPFSRLTFTCTSGDDTPNKLPTCKPVSQALFSGKPRLRQFCLRNNLAVSFLRKAILFLWWWQRVRIICWMSKPACETVRCQWPEGTGEHPPRNLFKCWWRCWFIPVFYFSLN